MNRDMTLSKRAAGIGSDKDQRKKLWISKEFAKRHTPRFFFLVTGTSVIVLIALVLHFFVGVDFPGISIHSHTSAQYWGQLGDFFGGMLNPILSFATFVMVLFAFYGQVEDSQDAEEESKRQLDNHRFFELVSLMHEVARGAEVDDLDPHAAVLSYKTYNNHRALGRCYNILERNHLDLFGENSYADRSIIVSRYLDWRNRYWPTVSTYIESLFFILDRYVLTVEKTIQDLSEDGTYYLSALKAQTSSSERNMLFLEMLRRQEWHIHLDRLHQLGFWNDAYSKFHQHRGVLIEQTVRYFQDNQSV